MTVSDLISELGKYPAHVPVIFKGQTAQVYPDIELAFTGNSVMLDAEVENEDGVYDDRDMILDDIDALITESNSRTGTKKELLALVDAIREKLKEREED